MIVRIIFLTLFTALTTLLATWQDDIGRILLIGLSAFGCISIFETVRTFKRLELRSNVLTIRQSFSRTRSFKLEQVQSWSEQSFHIRGHLKKSLILFFQNDQKITIDIYDDVKEFENLNQFLIANLSNRRD